MSTSPLILSLSLSNLLSFAQIPLVKTVTHIHHERIYWQKRHFGLFCCKWSKFQVIKISTLSDLPFSFSTHKKCPKMLVVLHHSQKEWTFSDQRWACNICLLLKTSKMFISTAWPIVQWLTQWVTPITSRASCDAKNTQCSEKLSEDLEK